MAFSTTKDLVFLCKIYFSLLVKQQLLGFYDKFIIEKLLATLLEEITPGHYQAIAFTENRNLEFFLRSSKLLEITKNFSQVFPECSK